MKRENKKRICMKMSKKDLIRARRITQELFCKAILEFGISVVLLTFAVILTVVFVPHVLTKVTFIALLLFGMTFGIVIGSLRAYNIFWEKTDFEKKETTA